MSKRFVMLNKVNKIDIPEYSLHCQIAQLLWQILGNDVFWTTIENSNHTGGKAGYIKQGQDKKKGVKAGMVDILILWKSSKALFIELKTEKGVLSDNQKNVHESIKKTGHHVELARSAKDIVDLLDKYGVPHREVDL